MIPTPVDLLDDLPDAVILVDDAARLVWGNRAALDLFGFEADDVVGIGALDFVHPDDLQSAALSFASVGEKRVGSLLELRVRGADGWQLVEMRGRAVPGGVVLTLRDLTDRRRWEVAGDEVARFRSLTQNSSSITLLLDASGLVTSSSGALSRLLGIDQEQLEGRPLAELVEAADRDRLATTLSSIGSARSTGQSGAVTVDLRLLDRRDANGRGSNSDAAMAVVPFAMTFTDLSDDPTVEGILVTGHDISDRVRVEGELRGANAALAATLESTVDGVLVVDAEGRSSSANRPFREMWLGGAEPGVHDDDQALASVIRQVVDPAAFMATVHEVQRDPEAATSDTLELKDGRVIERRSLPQRIDGHAVGRVWSFRDVTEQRRMSDELAHQAFHDTLTGLANQALFSDRVEHALARLERSGGHAAVLFIDLDDFKAVNDHLGHAVGDGVLIAVAERILACLRPGDTGARLGGDEFAVLIDEVASPDDASTIADRIVEAVAQPVSVSSNRVHVAASVGVAYGSVGVEVHDLLRDADVAMYTAKSAGKGCVRIYESGMERATEDRLDLELRLEGAAERGELVLHYQPIHELASGRIVAMEALVRWAHPERGLLGPQAFLGFAEEGGLIDEIGHHVLVTACGEAGRWAREAGVDAPAVSVNLSPRQLLDTALPDRVELMLHRTGLHAAQLILEVTESALMRDPTGARTALDRLGGLGVRLAIDDFGTGQSSLAMLRGLPVDLLKIDRAFIDDDLAGPGWSLAEAILQICRALGLVSVAEGVETDAQAQALRELGCSLAQGYHLGRPMGADAAGELVRRSTGTIPTPDA